MAVALAGHLRGNKTINAPASFAETHPGRGGCFCEVVEEIEGANREWRCGERGVNGCVKSRFRRLPTRRSPSKQKRAPASSIVPLSTPVVSSPYLSSLDVLRRKSSPALLLQTSTFTRVCPGKFTCQTRQPKKGQYSEIAVVKPPPQTHHTSPLSPTTYRIKF